MRYVVVVCVLAALLAGCRVAPEERSPRVRPTPTDAPLFGAALYQQRCAVCHGEQGEGKGKVGTALRSPEFLTTVSDEYLATATALGRPGTTMTAWAENGLTDAQIQSLVQHMRQWQTTPNVPLDNKTAQGDKARGEALYTETCATCHGPNGQAARDPNLQGTSIGNPVFLSQASDAFLTYAIAHGRSGTVMIPYAKEKGGPLDARQIEDIVTYMRTWPK